ncbi:MAG: peptide chain release factor N(5)-glutamine methyltransferase [Solirubrobacterales bacterium]
MTTVADALDSALVALTAARVDSPRLDAELLLADALGVDRTRLYLEPELRVEGPPVRRFQELVRRRAVEREPVAYLLGRKGFRRLELEVDGRVLVPRPETELLVEVAVAQLAPGARVVDVGTGSGAIALALADERPDLRVTGSDVSADALAVARANGQRLGLPVAWVEADGLAPGSGTRWWRTCPMWRPASGWRRRSPATSRRSRCSPGRTGSTRSAHSSPRRRTGSHGWRSSTAPSRAPRSARSCAARATRGSGRSAISPATSG